MPPIEESERTIMVVDDNPANLKLLEDALRQKGYKVRSFPRGRLALAAASENPPDLLLLDVNMPEMNGYQVCHHLKAAPALAGIPVLFISALNQTEDKIKGFCAGGVDYISKPFQFEEVYWLNHWSHILASMIAHRLGSLLRLEWVHGQQPATAGRLTKNRAELK